MFLVAGAPQAGSISLKKRQGGLRIRVLMLAQSSLATQIVLITLGFTIVDLGLKQQGATRP